MHLLKGMAGGDQLIRWVGQGLLYTGCTLKVKSALLALQEAAGLCLHGAVAMIN